jgi:hypothetical protein
MVQVELNYMYINMGANNGSEKLRTKKNTATLQIRCKTNIL